MSRTVDTASHFVAADDSTSSLAGPVAGALDGRGNPLTNLGNFGRGYFGQGKFGGAMSNTKIVSRQAEGA